MTDRAQPHDPPPLEWTGERMIPGIGGEVEVEHLHRYALACQLVAGKTVLDVACGEGYGSALLSAHAAHVIGVDISEAAIQHARSAYPGEKLHFEVANCSKLPCTDQSIDVVVSFETIEHIAEHDEFLREIKRVLRPGGLLIMSSPDKRYYSDNRNFNNDFHVRELYAEQFRDLLNRHFAQVDLYGQRVMWSSVVAARTRTKNSSFLHVLGNACEFTFEEEILTPLYVIALGSDAVLPTLPTSVFEATKPLEETVRQDARKGYRRIETFPYRIGTTVDCRSGGSGPLYLTDGWARADSEGTWTNADVASICLYFIEDMPTGQERIFEVTFRPFTIPGKHICSVELLLNQERVYGDGLVERGPLTWKISLPQALLRKEQSVVLNFRFSGLCSPADLGFSTDPRRLGLCLRRFRIQ